MFNAFSREFEVLICAAGIDSSLSDNFGRSIIYALSASTTIVTVSVVGGPVFIVAALLLGAVYWNGKQLFVRIHGKY